MESQLAPCPLALSLVYLNRISYLITSHMQSVNRFLFGPTPEEKVKKWQQQLKQESRALDREIRQLDTASNKVKTEVRKLAQKGDTRNAKLLARELVRSNKQKDRLHTSQARLNSINMQLSHQLGACAMLCGPREWS